MLDLRILIRKIDLAIRRKGGEMLAEHGLTQAQGELLYQLILKDGSDQNSLAENLGVTKASLSNLLDGMQELDLIKRVHHPEDSRLKQIFLTAHARDVIAKMGSVWNELESRMSEGFSKVEVDLLEDWLRRIHKNLENF